MSVNDLTIRAGLVLGMAIVALLLVGWRKPARAIPRTVRGDGGRPRVLAVPVERLATAEYHPPSPLRRLGAGLASIVLALVIGAAIATVVAFAASVIVTTMTDMLRR